MEGKKPAVFFGCSVWWAYIKWHLKVGSCGKKFDLAAPCTFSLHRYNVVVKSTVHHVRLKAVPVHFHNCHKCLSYGLVGILIAIHQVWQGPKKAIAVAKNHLSFSSTFSQKLIVIESIVNVGNAAIRYCLNNKTIKFSIIQLVRFYYMYVLTNLGRLVGLILAVDKTNTKWPGSILRWILWSENLTW